MCVFTPCRAKMQEITTPVNAQTCRLAAEGEESSIAQLCFSQLSRGFLGWFERVGSAAADVSGSVRSLLEPSRGGWARPYLPICVNPGRAENKGRRHL